MATRLGRAARCALALALASVGTGYAGEFDCIIEPSKTVDVRAASEGLIEKIWVDRGDMVKKDQVLVLAGGVVQADPFLARGRLNQNHLRPAGVVLELRYIVAARLGRHVAIEQQHAGKLGLEHING